MSLNLKDCVLKAVKEAKDLDAALTECKTPKFRKPTPPPPPTTGSNAVKPKKPCTYETPCGWCTKWDKKCDRKIGCNKSESKISIKDRLVSDSVVSKIIEDVINYEKGFNNISNIFCKLEEDHEWECCGMSTEGSSYRCKKCGKYKFEPYTTSTSNYYEGESK